MEASDKSIAKEQGNQADGSLILESLFDLWINQDPAYDEHIQQLYEKLEDWTKHMCLAERDRLTGMVADFCIAYSRKGFLDGVRMGGLLIQEILLEK